MYVLDNGKRLGRTRTIYRDEYFSLGGHNGMKYVPRRGSLPKILDKVKDISHTLKSEDYISLPGMMINSVPVKLNPKTMDFYSSMEKKFFMTIDGEDIEAVNAAAKSGKLRQITCGFSYNDQGDPVALPGAGEKMKALQEILEAYPYESFIIVAEFTELANQLIKKIKGSVAINGSTSVTESMKAVQGWNSGKVRRLVVHPASVSHGMNLQFGGRMIVWMGPIWNLEYWLQLNARLHRQGQIRPVIVNVLTAVNTIDVVVASRLKQKGATQDTLLAGIREYWDQKRGATNA
jgi:SNF2 family DNA or RNA helicase